MSKDKLGSTPELRIIPNKEHSHSRVGFSEVQSFLPTFVANLVYSRSASADTDIVFVLRASRIWSSDMGTGPSLASKTTNSRGRDIRDIKDIEPSLTVP